MGKTETVLLIYDLVSEEEFRTTVILKDDATVSDMLLAAGCGNADFSKYYPFSGRLLFGERYLPFLFFDGHISYDVPYEKARVTDFISTMDLSENEIEISVGIPWAGGPGLCDLAQMWDSAALVLNALAAFCSVTGITVVSIISSIRQKFQKRRIKPQTCFDIIYCRKMWNHHELAKWLEIDPDHAKFLLKASGYIYDNRKKLYVQGEKTDEIKNKLTQVKGLDIGR